MDQTIVRRLEGLQHVLNVYLFPTKFALNHCTSTNNYIIFHQQKSHLLAFCALVKESFVLFLCRKYTNLLLLLLFRLLLAFCSSSSSQTFMLIRANWIYHADANILIQIWCHRLSQMLNALRHIGVINLHQHFKNGSNYALKKKRETSEHICLSDFIFNVNVRRNSTIRMFIVLATFAVVVVVIFVQFFPEIHTSRRME